MSSHLLDLVFLLVYTAALQLTNGNVEVYISPPGDTSCPQDPCLTLSQLTTDPTNYTGNKTSISLLFLPGNHILDGELSLYGDDNFSM